MCLAAVACTRYGDEQRNDDILLENEVSLQTRGAGTERAFLFYLDGIDGQVTSNVETYGTYFDRTAGSVLVPCDVDANGVYVGDNPSKGLHARDGKYTMFIASPAVLPSVIPGTDSKGYHYTRNIPQSGNENIVYVSKPVEVSLNGVFLSSDSGFQYEYNVAEQVLKQPRSRMTMEFACGDKIAETTLRKILLKNIIKEGYYVPIASYFHFDRTNGMEDKRLFPKADGPQELHLTTGSAPVDLGVDEYILSMDYREIDDNGNYLWPQPTLEIHIGQDEENVFTIVAPLGYTFKPQNVYGFRIIINSVHVNMTVTAQEWTVVDGQEALIGAPQTWEFVIPLTDAEGNPLLDWEHINGGTGVIG